jgi:hypothetical protein
MEIMKGIRVKDLGLVVDGNLVIADTHVGYEEALNKQGVLIPRFQFKELIDRLKGILEGNRFDKIVVNGDVKHEFGTISETEWRHTLKLLDFLKKYCSEVVLVRGNHDKILGPIAQKRGVRVVDKIVIGDVLVVHGDKMPSKADLDGVKTVVIGHEHPAISLREGSRVETFKCFLKGKFKGKGLIVMPSFNLVQEGTDVLKEKVLSPLLKQNLDEFEVYIVADKVYRFGELRKLR